MTTLNAEPADASAKRVTSTRFAAATVVAIVSVALLVVGLGWSVAIGPTNVGLGDIFSGVVLNGHSTAAEIIHGIRLPRALLAALVGANAAVAGALMQSVTANPLGAPEILGVNAGAALVAVAAATYATSLAGVSTVVLAFIGAAVTGVLVLVLAGMGRGRTDPVRLALAGVTMTTLLLSITQTLIIFNDDSAESVFHWIVGGVNLGSWLDVHTILPWTVLGIVGALAIAGKLNILGLGEDLARGLGVHIGRIRLLAAALVVVLAGSAVAVAGPITFVGLIVPHIVRRLVGANHYVVVPLAGVVGAAMLVYADIVSRYIDPPAEVPSGVVTALVGAPFFIYLARQQKLGRQ